MALTRTTAELNLTLSLTGRVESITMMDLRKNPGEVMDQVELGKIFTITRAGKVVAELRRVDAPVMGMVMNNKAGNKAKKVGRKQ